MMIDIIAKTNEELAMTDLQLTDLRKKINDLDISDELKQQLGCLSDDEFKSSIENINKSLNKVIKAFLEFSFEAQRIIKQAIKDRQIDIDWEKLSFKNNI